MVKKDEPAEGNQTISPENIDRIEKEAIEQANVTLSALENAMSVWENSKEKKDYLKEKFVGYRKLHDTLGRVGEEDAAIHQQEAGILREGREAPGVREHLHDECIG